MKILLATDGSDFSLTAARKMCELLALEKGSEILVLSVTEQVGPSSRFEAADEYFVLARRAAAGASSAAATETREVVERCIRNENVHIDTRVIEGNPKSVIVDCAKQWNADLVVTGSHGRGFWGRMLIGSVSDAVVRHAPCSVLIIRD